MSTVKAAAAAPTGSILQCRSSAPKSKMGENEEKRGGASEGTTHTQNLVTVDTAQTSQPSATRPPAPTSGLGQVIPISPPNGQLGSRNTVPPQRQGLFQGQGVMGNMQEPAAGGGAYWGTMGGYTYGVAPTGSASNAFYPSARNGGCVFPPLQGRMAGYPPAVPPPPSLFQGQFPSGGRGIVATGCGARSVCGYALDGFARGGRVRQHTTGTSAHEGAVCESVHGPALGDVSNPLPYSVYGEGHAFPSLPGRLAGHLPQRRNSFQQQGSFHSQRELGDLHASAAGESIYGGCGYALSFRCFVPGTSDTGVCGSAVHDSSYGNRNGISQMGSIYGNGVGRVPSPLRTSLCPVIATIKDHVPLQRSGLRGGNVVAVGAAKCGGEGRSADELKPVLASPGRSLASQSECSPAGDDSSAQTLVLENYNIHSLVILDKDEGPSDKVVVTVKDPRTVVFRRSDGGEEEHVNDECLERSEASAYVNSVLLNDLRLNWIAGRTSALLVGAGRNCGDTSVTFAGDFLQRCLESVEGAKEKCKYFDVTITLGMMESSDRILDLLDTEKKGYERVQLASNPVYGPCLLGMKTKKATSSKECMEVFNSAMQLVDNPKHLIVGFFVLKQLKKTANGGDVYLSSLCIGLAKEEVSRFAALKEKDTSEPHRLFRYAIGGGSVTVSTLILSQCDTGASDSLDVERRMREVKNTPPRIGSVLRCVESAKKEINRQQEKMKDMDSTGKEPTARLVSRMESIVRDAEEMLANPITTAPKGYLIV
ncbi:hypothetical protein, conserved [Trypanosoma brucei brucei TREU927]|uniref:Uncharacterized protein n=1 Tax=Trypanosoma brucei brucei (strain 927/4 GUTat10.1) TaxID=185431 RepID=Q586E3_TRYB2|nr:hypothetical protein, conserved [Trypanosoma brucei brucei TREU927]AAQ16006.1 hypothetical protein, conserved [Trypanosoma brucei brucei TREU927]AAX78987.1 hypothetical protein, conserved [Trypanosoma brucei]